MYTRTNYILLHLRKIDGITWKNFTFTFLLFRFQVILIHRGNSDYIVGEDQIVLGNPDLIPS